MEGRKTQEWNATSQCMEGATESTETDLPVAADRWESRRPRPGRRANAGKMFARALLSFAEGNLDHCPLPLNVCVNIFAILPVMRLLSTLQRPDTNRWRWVRHLGEQHAHNLSRAQSDSLDAGAPVRQIGANLPRLFRFDHLQCTSCDQ